MFPNSSPLIFFDKHNFFTLRNDKRVKMSEHEYWRLLKNQKEAIRRLKMSIEQIHIFNENIKENRCDFSMITLDSGSNHLSNPYKCNNVSDRKNDKKIKCIQEHEQTPEKDV